MNSVSFKTNIDIQYSYLVDENPNSFLNYSYSVKKNEYQWQNIRIRFFITPIQLTFNLTLYHFVNQIIFNMNHNQLDEKIRRKKLDCFSNFFWLKYFLKTSFETKMWHPGGSFRQNTAVYWKKRHFQKFLFFIILIHRLDTISNLAKHGRSRHGSVYPYLVMCWCMSMSS